jgi:isocitrate/isopropylmalate dehydrogenase
MLLDYLDMNGPADQLRQAITTVYADTANLTVDQGGTASTSGFFDALHRALANT